MIEVYGLPMPIVVDEETGRWYPIIAGGDDGEADEPPSDEPTDGESDDSDDEGRASGEKKYSDRDMAGLRRSLEAKYEKRLSGLQSRLDELQAFQDELLDILDEYAGEEGDEEVEGDEEGLDVEDDEGEEGDFDLYDLDPEELEALGITEADLALYDQIAEMQDQLEALRERLAEEEEAKQEAEQMRLEAERDYLLAQALKAANAVDIEGGLRYLRDEVYYDPDSGSWYFYDPKTEEVLSIEEGVKRFLPNWLKEPKIREGGSGSRGAAGMGGPGESPPSATLERVKKLGMRAAQTRQQGDIAAYLTAKKEFLRSGGKPEDLARVVRELQEAS